MYRENDDNERNYDNQWRVEVDVYADRSATITDASTTTITITITNASTTTITTTIIVVVVAVAVAVTPPLNVRVTRCIVRRTLQRTTWFLFNLVTTHVLHLWSLLLVHLLGPLWKSLIALFGMLHLVYGMNSPLIFASLVRYSLLHLHLSHMAVHHLLLYHLHYHHLHLLLLVQSFILNFRLGSSANHFLHRPFPFLLDWLHGLSDHLMCLFCSTAGFVCMLC